MVHSVGGGWNDWHCLELALNLRMAVARLLSCFGSNDETRSDEIPDS